MTANPTIIARSCQIPAWLLLLSLAKTSKNTTYKSVPAAIPCSTTDVTSISDVPDSLNAIPVPIPTRSNLCYLIIYGFQLLT